MTLDDIKTSSGVAFGTSGARGLVSAMTDEVCAAYTQAFLQTLQGKFSFDRVAIAIDLRPSSLSIAQACARMVRQLGYQVVYCGEIPTPALAYYAALKTIPAIMVTGSHIPFDRNGLKFYRPDGEITKADEVAMLACEVTALQPATLALDHVVAEARAAYISRYTAAFDAQALAGLNVGVYQHSSVCRDVLPDILQALGASVTSLERSDQFVPIDTEAVSAADVQKGLDWSRQYGFDAIISTDGDGDRPLISDEAGNWLRGDIVGLLTARTLEIKHLAVPVSCNSAIEKSGLFEQVVRTRIGSPFVIAAMQSLASHGNAAVAGFEANGGFLLNSDIMCNNGLKPLLSLPTRDAVLPVVAILAEGKKKGFTVAQMVAQLPQRFTASGRLENYPTAQSQRLLVAWADDQAALVADLQLGDEVSAMDQTDGLRLTLQNLDVVHLRPSGNAPEFRCYAESQSQSAADRLMSTVLARLAQFRQ